MTDTPEKPAKKKGKKPSSQLQPGPGIWPQVAIAFAIFLLLSGGYTAVRQYWLDSTAEVPLSQIAADVGKGEVTELIIAGIRSRRIMPTARKKNHAKKAKRHSRKHSQTTALRRSNSPA